MFKKKSLTFEEGLARTKKIREIKTGISIAVGLVFVLFFWYAYMFGSGAESCTAAYVNGKYGEGREAVQQFKDECSTMSKYEALDDVTKVSNNINSSETERLRTDILNYW